MDAIDKLKEDVRQGRVDVERLLDVLVSLQRQLEAARQRIEELEKKLGGPGAATPAKIDKPFSMRAEEKRQRDRKQNKRKLSRRGRRRRLTSADKLKLHFS